MLVRLRQWREHREGWQVDTPGPASEERRRGPCVYGHLTAVWCVVCGVCVISTCEDCPYRQSPAVPVSQCSQSVLVQPWCGGWSQPSSDVISILRHLTTLSSPQSPVTRWQWAHPHLASPHSQSQANQLFIGSHCHLVLESRGSSNQGAFLSTAGQLSLIIISNFSWRVF